MANQNKTQLVDSLMNIRGGSRVTALANALGISVDGFLRKAQKNDFSFDDILLIANALDFTVSVVDKTSKATAITIDVDKFFSDDPVRSKQLQKAHEEYLRKKQKQIDDLQEQLDKLKQEMELSKKE